MVQVGGAAAMRLLQLWLRRERPRGLRRRSAGFRRQLAVRLQISTGQQQLNCLSWEK